MSFSELLEWLVPPPKVQITSSERPATAPTAPVPPNASTGRRIVGADRRPLWQIRGWREKGTALVGAFRTPFGSVAGEIFLKANPPEFYVVNPPPALLKGPHASCFRFRGGSRYFVHFGRASSDVDAGITAIEGLLVDALSTRRASRG